MSCTRAMIVAQAASWLGCKESDGSHKKIIDTYNSYKPLARGYKLKYTDSWCAGFGSAVAIACEATDIIPTEVGCGKHIALFQKMGIWVEDDAYVPAPGDYIFYDWQDDGIADDTGSPDHEGIVEKVSGGKIIVIEGNYSDSVKRRTLAVNGKYIRGYGVPKYDAEPVEITTTKKGDYTMEMRNLKKGCRGDDVRALQILLIGRGYSCGTAGADGDFGSGTYAAVTKYQKAKGLTVDGIAGEKTMGSLLGV